MLLKFLTFQFLGYALNWLAIYIEVEDLYQIVGKA